MKRLTFRYALDLQLKLFVTGIKVIFTVYAGLFAFIAPGVLAYGVLHLYALNLVVGPILPLFAYFLIKMLWFEKDEPAEGVS